MFEEPIKVKSSNIASISYDEEFNILRVKFHTGSIYDYDDVPMELYNKFLKSTSKGKFFHENIRPLDGRRII